jgi:hypothetical protein
MQLTHLLNDTLSVSNLMQGGQTRRPTAETLLDVVRWLERSMILIKQFSNFVDLRTIHTNANPTHDAFR